MEQFNTIKNAINAKTENYPVLVDLEKQSGVERAYIAVLGGIFVALALYFLGGPVLVVNLIGFGYPSYMSFKALATPQPDDDTQWLTYWVVYAFFNLTEQLTTLFTNYIPFYWGLKCGFLIWCYAPATLGANKVYHGILKSQLAPFIEPAPKKAK